MPTTRAHAARERSRHTGMELEPSMSPALEEVVDQRQRRLLHILALFDPEEAVPASLRQHIEARLTGNTEDIDTFKARYFAVLCSVIIQASENDEDFFLRMNTVVPESFCAIDVIRKHIDGAFRSHDEYWRTSSFTAPLDADGLDTKLREHVARIGTITRTPRIDKVAAIFAVATLLEVVKGVVNYHTPAHPSCDRHQVLLHYTLSALEAFPEDVLPANLDTIEALIQLLDSEVAEPSETKHRLARRLEKLVRFVSAAPGKRRIAEVGEGEAGSSKRPAR